MSSATLTVRVAPRRMLTQAEAADYVGVPTKLFAKGCSVRAVDILGQRRFDIQDLDAWIEALKDGDVGSEDDIIARL